MSKAPLVSVITATYNLVDADRERLFIKGVKSVRSQTYKNLEHIIVDGASTDGTLNIIDRLGILNCYSEPDDGIYDAFNKGIKYAKGKYIVFLNSDDFWHDENGLEKAIECLEKNKADYCFSPAKLIDKNKISYQPGKIYASFSRMPICHQTLICKKEVLEQLNGFDTSFKIVADYDLLLRLVINKFKYSRLNYTFTSFTVGGASSDEIKSNEESIKVLENVYSKLGISADIEKIYKTQTIPVFAWKNLLPFFRLKEQLNFIKLYTKNNLKNKAST